VLRKFFNEKLGGRGLAIKSISAIYNPLLVKSFCNQQIIMQQRFKDHSKLFTTQNWKESKNELKNWVHELYRKKVEQFDWNEKSNETNPFPIYILPVVHGCDGDVALKICMTGFANLSLLDQGWYGQGVYFSTSTIYTLPYFVNKNIPAIVLAYVLPGNTYPVTEDHKDENTLLGQPIKSGYNSHYVATLRNGVPPKSITQEVYDEVVIPQEAQIVPAFVININTKNCGDLIDRWNREISVQ